MAEAPPRVGLDLPGLLQAAMQSNASDIHLKPGRCPVFRINGELVDLAKHPKLTAPDVAHTAETMLDERLVALFKENNEVDLAYSLPGVGRFRVNIYRQRGSIAIAMRSIPYQIRNFDDLGLPPALHKICLERRGLVLVTGSTGSGKSTTLASMVEAINSTRTCHIITIEDPIEFLIRDKKSIISQREVGFDTKGFGSALRVALRQDPDVIFVGEMRDFETMTTALQAAETGHLVLSTLHTTDVMETISRVLAVFPTHQEDLIRFQLASCLRAIVCQRLIARADGRGRAPAVEVLVNNARVHDCIRDAKKTGEIPDIIAQSFTTYGMQTFDMSLMQLVQNNIITIDAALENASNPGDFKLRLRGVSGIDEARYDEYRQGQPKKKPGGEGGQGGQGGAGGGFGDLLERFSE
jgi:twitching motility protein PilT